MSDPVCCRSRDDNADGLDLGVTSLVKAEGDSLGPGASFFDRYFAAIIHNE